jgi:hypothetical protein
VAVGAVVILAIVVVVVIFTPNYEWYLLIYTGYTKYFTGAARPILSSVCYMLCLSYPP